ncbi:guanylate cyclase [Chloropicon primus]|nr:guanylate cyclase [Chloropicon primus]
MASAREVGAEKVNFGEGLFAQDAEDVLDASALPLVLSVSEQNLEQLSKERLKASVDYAQRFYVEALDSSPVEDKTFKEHTWWPGLFFKTWRTERVFLDGFAKSSVSLVYTGYATMLIISILIPLQVFLKAVFKYNAPCPPDLEYLCKCFPYYSGREDVCFEGTTTDLFMEAMRDYLTRSLPILATIMALGSLSHFFIHWWDRAPKALAMVPTFVAYLVLLVFSYINGLKLQKASDGRLNSEWVNQFFSAFLLILPSFLFFSGSPQVLLYFVLVVIGMAEFGTILTESSRTLEQYGSTSVYFVRLQAYFNQTAYMIAIFILVTLCGALLQELKARKVFLQRVLLTDQQEEIIRYKTQNTKLQKDLLNKVLPSTIVEQLEEENFVIQSWSQLRNLSQHHSGVCIAFAELEGFATFSSQVHPSSVLNYLDDLFLVFDGLCDDHEVYKVETVGDQYVAAVGVVTGKMHNERVSVNSAALPENECNGELRDVSVFNTDLMISFAKAIMKGSRCVEAPEADVKPVLRIGIHTGPCMSGIVGTKTFRFCLFGDAMNTSARMVQIGPAECIHTTQDVVGLVPDEPWEKLKKMEVKGKGVMQTYLLRCDNAALADPEDPAHGCDIAPDDLDDFFFLRSEDDLRVNESKGEGRKDYQDIQPVSRHEFRMHTKYLGLFFKSWNIERAYLDGQARQDKTAVYFGYAAFVLIMLSNVLFGYCFQQFEESVCSESYDVCVSEFGVLAVETGSGVSWESMQSASILNLSPLCAGLVFALPVMGVGSHFAIHRLVQEKWWASVCSLAVYILLMLFLCLNAFFWGKRPLDNKEWTLNVFFSVLVCSTLLTFFGGVACLGCLTWWLCCFLLVYTLGPITVQNDMAAGAEENVFAPIAAGSNFAASATALVMYGILLLIGAYLRDIASRRRFLQGVMSRRQQNQILQEKIKAETMTRIFLESILPPRVVEQMKRIKRSLGQPSCLSQRHFGVSILYADLVGFTEFCRRVDPFTVLVFLNDLFVIFDQLCDDFNVYKVETVGDCYVATVGVVSGELNGNKLDGPESPNVHGAENTIDMIGFAKAVVWGSREITKPVVNTPATLRVGVHTGSCISGVIGTKVPKFSILGDDVALAALMEKKGKPDHIHASESVVALVPNEAWEKHTLVVDSADGRERVVETFLLSV